MGNSACSSGCKTARFYFLSIVVYLLNLSLSPLLVGAVVVFYPLIHLLVMRYISHDASLPPDRNRNESR
jgi:hypothetical protein